MAKETKTMPIRLAMRVEGDWWVAYLAQMNTMEGAKRLGSIRLGIVEKSDAHKQAFLTLMTGVVSDGIKEITGQSPDWNAPQAAPEAERSGRA